RRTTILSDDDLPVTTEVDSVEISDQPCYVLYSQAGLLARTESDQIPAGGTRVKYDAIAAQIETRSRAQIGLVTSEGRLLRVNVVDLPVTVKAGLASNIAASSLVSLKRGEQVVGITSLDPTSSLALATSNGVIKRLDLADLPNKDAIEIINLKVGDSVVGSGWIASDDEPLGVMITEDARLLQLELADIRAQGINAAGVAGMKTSSRGKVIGFFIAYEYAEVITVAGAADALPGTNHSSIKLTELAEFSITARGGSGVRCHKFRKGETSLVTAFVGASPVVANTARGATIELPELSERDATGEKLTSQVTALGSLLS
ncbi:MAG: DNA gyrase C-terminal beta-propeller domain-containing protein, partial [Candidatus Nanopelagicales bacterium]